MKLLHSNFGSSKQPEKHSMCCQTSSLREVRIQDYYLVWLIRSRVHDDIITITMMTS